MKASLNDPSTNQAKWTPGSTVVRLSAKLSALAGSIFSAGFVTDAHPKATLLVADEALGRRSTPVAPGTAPFGFGGEHSAC